ncbi:MAG: hypothetical protein K2L80_02955 [Muribaculaceae bacterium]|nr:hypothetical protein [Muribaculaceae bacterium]MDE6331540.1 hypothetical protein [Muribaculaceae bacterium]
MKFKLILPVVLLAVAAMSLIMLESCSRGYDSATCASLTDKLSRGESLSQDEYAKMIEQYDLVLEYLVQRTDSVMLIEDDTQRVTTGRSLRDDDEFNERWQVMFDFGSALYQARAAGLLSDFNLNNYMELLPYTERISRNMASI